MDLTPRCRPINAQDARRINKPLMEKKRRARINDSLGELKALVLDGAKKDSSRYSKLEKADILELAVKHLKQVQRAQMSAAMATDPGVLHRYRKGYQECAMEVQRYLCTIDGISEPVKSRILSHLSTCMSATLSLDQRLLAPQPPMQIQIPAPESYCQHQPYSMTSPSDKGSHASLYYASIATPVSLATPQSPAPSTSSSSHMCISDQSPESEFDYKQIDDNNNNISSMVDHWRPW